MTSHLKTQMNTEVVSFVEDAAISPLPAMPNRGSFVERYATSSSDTMESILSDMVKRLPSHDPIL